MSKKETTVQFNKYVEEAQSPDFVIKVDDTTEIRVTNPDYMRLERFAQGSRSGDLDVVLGALCGAAVTDIKKLLAKAGHKAVPALMEDIMDHFDMYDEIELVGPGGGVVTEKRPTKIKTLIGLGYRPKGE